jgi:hypothetical protein
MQAGADKEARDDTQTTPLHLAAVKGNFEVCRAMMQGGADKEARDEKQRTPLHLAAIKGNVEVCRVLLEAGADKDARADRQQTPLHVAAITGSVDACRALTKAGADKEAGNYKQRTPLHLAASKGHESTCLALVLAGVKCHAIDARQQTPADLARSKGHTTLANHMQHSDGVYLLRCTGLSHEHKLAWNDTSEAEEEAMLDVMQAEWLAKVAQGRAHARVGQVLQRVHRRQLSMGLLTHILGFAIGGTAANLMSCVSQRLSTAEDTVEHSATAKPPARRQRIGSSSGSSAAEQALRSPRLALMSHQLALSITPTVLCSALPPQQIQRLKEAVSAVLARAEAAAAVAAVVAAAVAAAQGAGRGPGRVEAGCEWLEEYCVFVQGRFQL